MNDPLTIGILLSIIIIMMNEEVFRLLFLALELKRIEMEKGRIIVRTSYELFITKTNDE